MMPQDDRLMKEWANSYVEQYGRELIREQQMLEGQNVRYAMPRADARIKQLSSGRKNRSKTPFVLATAAALLVVFVGATVVFTQFDLQTLKTFLPIQSSNVASSQPDPTESATITAPSLDFTLPARFTVASVESDEGETVYHLDDTQYDDTILSVRAAEENTNWMDDMDEVTIDGTIVPAKLHDEYKLLCFEKDGSLYTISCRDDIKTLTTLYRSITV